MKTARRIRTQARLVLLPLPPGPPAKGGGEGELRKPFTGTKPRSGFSGFPLLTLAIVAATILVTAPSLGSSLQYDNRRFVHQPWRILACHLTHWSLNHLGWSLAAFIVLGTLCEFRDRFRYTACLLASATLIPLTLRLLQPSLATYRGLSGIDSALFFLAAIPLARERWRDNRRTALAACLLLAGFFAKTAFEAMTGRAAFARSAGAFVPVPLAHLVGAIIGAACAFPPRAGVLPSEPTGGGAARLPSVAGGSSVIPR